MRVVVIGQGYAGLPLAVRAAEVGHKVVGYDVDQQRVKRLAVADSYIEDVSSERLRAVLESQSYRPSSSSADCARFDIAVICVPTPLRDGLPDLSFIEASGRMLAGHIRPGDTVVLESTTYPGSTEELLLPILQDGSGLIAGADFHLGYSPERIDPGNPDWHLENTPKIVSGVDGRSLAAIHEFYASLVDTVVPVSGCKEAELAKLLENTFRHVNIALVNELAMFAHDLGIDIWSAIDAAATKPFGFLRFTPGPGVGGHCLPIDPSYLSWRVGCALGRNFRFVELANDVNGQMPDYVVSRLVEGLNARRRSVNGSRVMILGLSYKANTRDVRESPAIQVAHRLVRMGAHVSAADPLVVAGIDDDRIELARVAFVEATAAELAAADAVLLLVDHESFDYDAVVRHSRYVLDCRRRLSGPGVDLL
jgi:UDP-N-acetyl-D-glucosamine dehydrogenase